MALPRILRCQQLWMSKICNCESGRILSKPKKIKGCWRSISARSPLESMRIYGLICSMNIRKICKAWYRLLWCWKTSLRWTMLNILQWIPRWKYIWGQCTTMHWEIGWLLALQLNGGIHLWLMVIISSRNNLRQNQWEMLNLLTLILSLVLCGTRRRIGAISKTKLENRTHCSFWPRLSCRIIFLGLKASKLDCTLKAVAFFYIVTAQAIFFLPSGFLSHCWYELLQSKELQTLIYKSVRLSATRLAERRLRLSRPLDTVTLESTLGSDQFDFILGYEECSYRSAVSELHLALVLYMISPGANVTADPTRSQPLSAIWQ